MFTTGRRVRFTCNALVVSLWLHTMACGHDAASDAGTAAGSRAAGSDAADAGSVCTRGADCRDGYRCVTSAGIVLAADGGMASEASMGTCQPTPPTPGLANGLVGNACSSDDECGTGTCQHTIAVVNTSYPGGYCTGRCRMDSECGERGVCVPGLRGTTGSCYLGCDDDTGCKREGYLCRVVSGVGRCVPGSKPLPADIVGNACESDGDCGGSAMSCASMLGMLVATGGYCSQPCAIDGDCGAGGKCVNGISIVTINSGICYRTCSAPADCRAGYECRSLTGAGNSAGACVPVSESP